MASIPGLCSSSSPFKLEKFAPKPPLHSPIGRDSITFPNRSKLFDRASTLSAHSLAREVPATSLAANDGIPVEKKPRLQKDPRELWRRYVDWLYQHKELGLYLDVSRVGFTDEFVEAMEQRFRAAFEAMEELEKGAIANPDEGRMVGHYWLRNPKLAPKSFLRLQIENALEAVSEFANDVVSGKIKPPSSAEGCFTHVLSVGIGGSALGPQFVAEALAPDNPPLKIRFIDNTDPAGIDHQIAQLGPELSSTLVIVISKSGGTPETRNGLLEVQRAFREAGLEFAKQGVAITQENSLLDNTARIEGWLARFPMFDWVGGRTSEMSAVGLLPAALQGIDIREMLAGASLMDEATRTTVDKFDIMDANEDSSLAQEVSNKKAYILYKDWKCKITCHYVKLLETGDNSYSHPYRGVTINDWKYLINHVFDNPDLQRRRSAGKRNWAKLEYNHTMGSRSFPMEMSIDVKGGEQWRSIARLL